MIRAQQVLKARRAKLVILALRDLKAIWETPVRKVLKVTTVILALKAPKVIQA